MNKLKESKAITLIALIITIIVLLILAGVVINTTFKNDGILAKTQDATQQYMKAKYEEDVMMIVTESKMKILMEKPNEDFITIIKNTLLSKNLDWLEGEPIMCDDELVEHSNTGTDSTGKNTVLLLTTKSGYEIKIRVDNEKKNAYVEYIQKSEFSSCTITYDSNGGTGDVESQSTKKRFNVILRENSFSRTDFSFVGWCKNSDGTGEKYLELSKIKIEEDTTLYAIWSRNSVELTFYANNGTDEFKKINIESGVESQLPTNSFSKEGYVFNGWNTEQDGSGTRYKAGDTITINESTTLYAQWVKEVTNFDYVEDQNGNGYAQTFIVPATGTYMLETWGAQGGNIPDHNGGKGGYSVGKISLTTQDLLYVYVGGQGTLLENSGAADGKYAGKVAGGYNGGGDAYLDRAEKSSSGGGGTDIRINSQSLYARVIVAGGGAGTNSYNIGSTYYTNNFRGYTGYAGGLVGQNGDARYNYNEVAYGGTQTSGGKGATHLSGYWTYAESGSFGKGGDASTVYVSTGNTGSGGGGGGGWYGGGGGSFSCGAGGSSYVYTLSTASSYPSGCLLNSSYYLNDASTTDGAHSMPTCDGISTMTGNTGNGYARITFLHGED